MASAQLTNEDLFALRNVFKDDLKGALVDFKVPQKPGDSDDFLIKADKNPNTAGALAILGDTASAEDIIHKAKQGAIDVLYVFGHDLVKLLGKDTVVEIAKKVKLFVFQGSNVNETCSYATLVLPSTVYAEKEGTFTNFQQRVQRIWPAFVPIGESKGDWQVLSLLSEKLRAPLAYKRSEDIFNALAGAAGPFADMSYEKISDQGMVLKK